VWILWEHQVVLASLLTKGAVGIDTRR